MFYEQIVGTLNWKNFLREDKENVDLHICSPIRLHGVVLN
jgi:hypothetical protein